MHDLRLRVSARAHGVSFILPSLGSFLVLLYVRSGARGPRPSVGGESTSPAPGAGRARGPHTHRPVRVNVRGFVSRACIFVPGSAGERHTKFLARAQARADTTTRDARTQKQGTTRVGTRTLRSRGAWPRQARSRLSGRRAVAGWPRSSAAARETSRVRVRA